MNNKFCFDAASLIFATDLVLKMIYLVATYSSVEVIATQGTMPRSTAAGIKKIINRLKGKSGVSPALSP